MKVSPETSNWHTDAHRKVKASDLYLNRAQGLREHRWACRAPANQQKNAPGAQHPARAGLRWVSAPLAASGSRSASDPPFLYRRLARAPPESAEEGADWP